MKEPRVLIVESNEALRVLLFTILRHQPLAVDTATNYDDALTKAMSCDYALVIVDVDLPDNGGIQFIQNFRDVRPEATSFVIAVRDPKNENFLDPELVSAVLNKPLEIDTLAEVVRECAYVVPAPEDSQHNCPPSESEVRSKMERGPYIAN